jgi:hypothetical protein
VLHDSTHDRNISVEHVKVNPHILVRNSTVCKAQDTIIQELAEERQPASAGEVARERELSI